MIPLLTAILRQLMAGPIPWAVVALAALAWPVALLFSPLAATLGGESATALVYNVAFLSSLVGALAAGSRLDSLGWILARQGSARAVLLTLPAVALAALCLSLVALIPFTVLGGRVEPSTILVLSLLALHLAALGELLAACKFSATARSVALLFLALLLPASIPSDASSFYSLFALLDPLGGGGLMGHSFCITLAQLMSISCLTLAALGLRSLLSR